MIKKNKATAYAKCNFSPKATNRQSQKHLLNNLNNTGTK